MLFRKFAVAASVMFFSAASYAEPVLILPEKHTVYDKEICTQSSDGAMRMCNIDRFRLDLSGVDWIDYLVLEKMFSQAVNDERWSVYLNKDVSKMLKDVAVGYEEGIASAVEMHNEFFARGEGWGNIVEILESRFVGQKGKLATYKFENYTDHGGPGMAHSRSGYAVLDMSKKTWLGLYDVLVLGKEQALYELLLKASRKRGLGDSAEYEIADPDFRERLLGSGFVFNEKGISFNYLARAGFHDQEEVVLEIGVNELEGIIKPEYL